LQCTKEAAIFTIKIIPGVCHAFEPGRELGQRAKGGGAQEQEEILLIRDSPSE
jgi:hypothetical protein